MAFAPIKRAVQKIVFHCFDCDALTVRAYWRVGLVNAEEVMVKANVA